MVRPAKDSPVPGARERIEEAFLALMDKMPISKISVKMLCEHAGCNKTTFYYHFADASAVLAAIEDWCIPRSLPERALAARAEEPRAAMFSAFSPEDTRFKTFCKLLSSRGDPAFAPRVKQVMYGEWCRALGMEQEEPGAYNRVFTELVLGGTLGLYADYGDGKPFDPDVHARVLEAIVAPHIDTLFRQETASKA